LLYAAYALYRHGSASRKAPLNLTLVLPGVVNGAALLLMTRWFFTALPVVLDIPQRVRGQERVPGLFINELFASFQYPEIVDAGNLALVGGIIAIVLSIVFTRLVRSQDANAALVGLTGAALVGGLAL